MQPINYIPQNQPDFMRNFLTGLQAGSAISDMQAKQQEIANAQALKEQYSKDMQDAFKSGTSEAFGQLAIKYPSQREALKRHQHLLRLHLILKDFCKLQKHRLMFQKQNQKQRKRKPRPE